LITYVRRTVCGKQYYSRISGEGGRKLSFLNNMVGLFETEIDAAGNFSEKDWEWK